jgi:hypothetical protein
VRPAPGPIVTVAVGRPSLQPVMSVQAPPVWRCRRAIVQAVLKSVVKIGRLSPFAMVRAGRS